MKRIFLFPTEEEAAPLRAVASCADIRICGVGMAETAAATAGIILRESPQSLVLAGVAGAYDPSLRVCDVVAVCSECVESLPQRYRRTYRASAAVEGLRAVAGNTVTESGAAASAAQIEDMEGAAFFAVCARLGVAATCIRAISNMVGDARDMWRTDEAAQALAKELCKIYKLK